MGSSQVKSRRAKGEGTISYHADRDRWVGRVDLGKGPDGTRVRRAVTGQTRKEVANKLAQLRRQRDAGLVAGSASMTVGELLDRWLVSLAGRGVGSRMIETHEWAVGHLKPMLGKRTVAKLSVEDVEAVLNVKADAGYALNSVKRFRDSLGQALRWAQRRDIVHRNVASLADLPAARAAREGRPLTEGELDTFLGAIAGHRLEPLWITQVGLGLRPGEVAGLSWDDVNLDDDVVHVRSQLSWTGKPRQPSLTDAKGGSRRSLLAPSAVIEALRAHRIRQLEEMLAFDGSPGEWAHLVFTTSVVTPLLPRNIRRDFDRCLKGTGLEDLVPYDLRHTTASLLADRGLYLEQVADVLGHKGTRMARSVYVHAMRPTVDHGASVMDELLTKATEA